VSKSRKFPKMLPEPLQIYAMNGPYPDLLRVSFTDGSTQMYELKVKQPRPVLKDGLDRFTETCVGYEKTGDAATSTVRKEK
jgi:hypothetical protein